MNLQALLLFGGVSIAVLMWTIYLATWDALKWAMWQCYIPSYYARDKLSELQRLKQGTSFVEDYYQELQIGLMWCGLFEMEDAMMLDF